MDDELRSSRTELKRYPTRGTHDFETIAAILDEAFVCHVGFVANGQPYVLPTAYGRDGHTLYLHGSASGRLLNALEAADAVCVTVTLVDGLVLARSGFHSSVNYRSVVILGACDPVVHKERERALKIISDHIVPGRWEMLRPASNAELEQTSVLRMDIVEASAKIRTGPPVDDEEDYGLPVWAGTLDFAAPGFTFTPDARLDPAVSVPDYLNAYRRPATKRGA